MTYSKEIYNLPLFRLRIEILTLFFDFSPSPFAWIILWGFQLSHFIYLFILPRFIIGLEHSEKNKEDVYNGTSKGRYFINDQGYLQLGHMIEKKRRRLNIRLYANHHTGLRQIVFSRFNRTQHFLFGGFSS